MYKSGLFCSHSGRSKRKIIEYILFNDLKESLPEDWRKAALSAIQLPQGKSVSFFLFIYLSYTEHSIVDTLSKMHIQRPRFLCGG